MKVVIALRASNASQARQLLAEQACEIHKSRFESQEPALRNLIDGLYRRGLDVELQGASLAWFLVEGSLTPTQWLEQSAVAICFSFEWFQQQAAQIRYLKGIAYCDAAAGWAQLLPLDGTAPSVAQPEGKLDWQGLAVELAPELLALKKSEQSARVNDVLPVVSSGQDCLPEDSNSPDSVVTFKQNSARKIVGKLLTATKNIAKRKPKADAISDAQDENSLLVASKADASETSNSGADVAGQPVVKKRGRPRKNPEQLLNAGVDLERIESADVRAVVEQQVIVGAEVVGLVEPVAAPKKRGRPRKVVAPVEPEVDEEQLDLFV
ncbi:hypothetical protein QWY82_14520 [Simiduia curdlanivorans]|uniref:Uncharacterized protein n=1 Tax=Simiduia curdlanivorans TaxID=1492769 RepID=A0ABV8V1M0_9GAMM|nr:hypothetical protein [Simiduia curdlanivorans]MDN3640012.1 hypothetical protein [Simiduia curdlanivorans]